MLINRDELARKVLEGEITSLDDLNSVLRSMIKDVVETAMGAEMTGFLGYDRYQTPDTDPGNRRNGYSQKSLLRRSAPSSSMFPGTGNPSSRRPSSRSATRTSAASRNSSFPCMPRG